MVDIDDIENQAISLSKKGDCVLELTLKTGKVIKKRVALTLSKKTGCVEAILFDKYIKNNNPVFYNFISYNAELSYSADRFDIIIDLSTINYYILRRLIANAIHENRLNVFSLKL